MIPTPPAGPYDLAIAGGGLVGASLALALAPLGLRIALVEGVAPVAGSGEHPSFDERTTALANGTVRVFDSLGVWRHMAREATPIKRIHVSEQGRFGTARIDAAGQGLDALGYVLPNRVIGAALWAGLRDCRGIDVIAPARATGSEPDGDWRVLAFERDGAGQRIAARLVVAADGAKSLIRAQAGIGSDQWPYGQAAVIATITTQRFHDHVAYERFTPDGPIAVLPLAEGRCGIVWTRRPEEAARLLALADDEFLAEFQRAFGFRLGRILRVGKRHSYELELVRTARHTAARLAVIGNAAQSMHPIAGQGFNLGLRDAACLAEVIADARESGEVDPGAGAILEAYAKWREEDQGRIVVFTDGLVRLFGSPLWLVRGLRSAGLMAFDIFPPAKSAMARLSVGAAGRVPRLARGLPLVAGP